MDAKDLRTLVDYHYWARDRVLAALDPLTPEQYTRDLQSSFRSIRDTAVHTYAAEWAWYSRWIGASPTKLLSSDAYPDVASLRAAWIENEANVRAFTASAGDAGIDTIHTYTMFNGTQGASPFWQMLQHVVNHASYHRGQLTAMIRQVGGTPPQSMDMIAYYRAL